MTSVALLEERVIRYLREIHEPVPQFSLAKELKLNSRLISRILARLEKKGVIKRKDGKARALKITKRTDAMLLPVLGEIAAGEAIEMIPESEEEIEVPKTMVAVGYEHFVLRVRGESMIGDHIMDGDYVIIRKQSTANIGDIVAVSIDNSEATLKRLKYENNMVRLEPSNPDMEPIVIEPERVKILGKLVGVIRIL